MCSGYVINKNGYGYCNHGFVAHEACKVKGEVSDKFVPPCEKEESHQSVSKWDSSNIVEYRDRMENMPLKIRR